MTKGTTIKSKKLNASLVRWFDKHNNERSRMDKIISGTSKLSLRLIDWLVTNYSKRHLSFYFLDKRKLNTRRVFIIHAAYKDMLRNYHKKYFDPFCRGKYSSKRGELPNTKQLNFFKWAFKNSLIDYMERHRDEIERDMSKQKYLVSTKLTYRTPCIITKNVSINLSF